MHAATLENCPRCQIRDRISAPLAFKAFETIEFPERADSKPAKPRSLPLSATSERGRRDHPESGPLPTRESLPRSG
jgi:hypothetical protein